MRNTIPWLVLGLFLSLASIASSQNILLWDKDHGKVFLDPEGAGPVDASYGIEKALIQNGYGFTQTKSLPSDLNPYQIIFVVMGIYC